MSTRIFVSYAREDQAPAGALVDFLRKAGFDVWFDKDSLFAGQDWRAVIKEEIALARLLIICLSRRSVDKTGFVQKEMRLALEQAELRPSTQVYIVPVALDGCEVPSLLEHLHILDLRGTGASERLLQSIQNATGDGARAPQYAHDVFNTAIANHHRSFAIPVEVKLSAEAREMLSLIEMERDSDKKGLVEILREVRPGLTHYFPRLEYGGTPMAIKARIFSTIVEELVAAKYLFPPTVNPSHNTQTYEYRGQ